MEQHTALLGSARKERALAEGPTAQMGDVARKIDSWNAAALKALAPVALRLAGKSAAVVSRFDIDVQLHFRCGNGELYCGVGSCQSGNCTSSTVPPSRPSARQGDKSPDGTCGYEYQYMCTGSSHGDCCSAAGYCGKSIYHCLEPLGW